jgi:hypothetical protein
MSFSQLPSPGEFTMMRSSDLTGKLSDRALVAVTLLAIVGTSTHGLGRSLNQPPRPASSRADEALERWNGIGNKLVAMARIFPKTSTITRSKQVSALFADCLRHGAAVD